MVHFRNKVVHQGYIPKVAEAINYGDYILKNIYSLITDLNTKHPEGLRKAMLFKMNREGEKIKKNVSKSNMSVPTIINLNSVNSPEFGKKNFKEAIISMKNNSFYKDFYIKEI